MQSSKRYHHCCHQQIRSAEQMDHWLLQKPSAGSVVTCVIQGANVQHVISSAINAAKKDILRSYVTPAINLIIPVHIQLQS